MELIVFIVTAVIAIAGAVAMLLSRNAVHCALFLLLNFSSIAVLYLLLQAPFLFAVQLIVYAGAIIVLFLFVVMLLGAERSEEEGDRNAWQRPAALVMGLLLFGEALYVFLARSGVALQTAGTGDENFAAPATIGAALFNEYLLPFEITSVILLAAIVGVVVLHQRDPAASQATEGDALREMSTVAPEPTRAGGR